jgi:hypothetical protein
MEQAELLAEHGRQHLASGDRLATIDLARAALALDPGCFAAHQLLALVALDGENFRAIFARIHQHFRPRTYLEIGVGRGTTIGLVDPSTLAIGVDPAPQIDAPLPPNVRILREPSDAFFARDGVRSEFAGAPLEFAFIDGMHLFEYALRDFIHIERSGTPDTRVLVHDCYPLDEVTASRTRTTTFWTGDVWKLTLCLRRYRPDLQVSTLAAPPSGLCVIRRLDPGSTVLEERYAAICSELLPLSLSSLGADRRNALNLAKGDWQTACALLS